MQKKRLLILGISVAVVSVLLTIGVFTLVQYLQAHRSKTAPFAPSAVEANGVSCTEIQVEWQDNSTNETGFHIYRDGVVVGEASRNADKFMDRRLKYATNYEYSVSAYNSVGRSLSIAAFARTKNPPLTIRIDAIGVHDNGEELIRRIVDTKGEVYIGIVITDGKTSQRTDLPQTGKYYSLDDDKVVTVNQEVFRTAEVGELLHILIVGGEQDSGSGSQMLCDALDGAVKYSAGGPVALILDFGGVSLSGFFAQLLGTDDDFMGQYDREWTEGQNWGIGQNADIDCPTDRGTIGLRIWYTIDCPYTR